MCRWRVYGDDEVAAVSFTQTSRLLGVDSSYGEARGRELDETLSTEEHGEGRMMDGRGIARREKKGEGGSEEAVGRAWIGAVAVAVGAPVVGLRLRHHSWLGDWTAGAS